MYFKSLFLKNFRSYAQLSLQFPPGTVVFFGPNGQGKTNLMEAFYYLLRGESFRPLTKESLLYQQDQQVSPQASVQAQLVEGELVHELKTSLSVGKKQVSWNGNRVSSSLVSRKFPVVLFSPESLMAIKEGPEQRRQLVDDALEMHTLGSGKVLRDFRHALKTRNRLLRDFKNGLRLRQETRQLLDSLDPIFMPLAAELTVARLNALNALKDDFREATGFVLDRSDVDISVEYIISGQNASVWSRSDILYTLHNRAQELRDPELEKGASLVGPQRHDIRILFTGKDSRFFCSQGQQRALILAFKMAQILYHYRAYQVYPFLLLDDVLSELDPARRSNLVRFLKGIPAQIFLTTTDLSFSAEFGDRRLSIFRIENGSVEEY